IRMHGYGDFRNCEVKFAEQKPKGWWEYCTIWSKRQAWAYTNNTVYRPTVDILSELIKTKNWGGNYLLNIGPKADGEFPEAAIKGLTELSEWMAVHKESVIGSYPLPEDESANVYATARDNIRYLFILSDTQKNVELKGIKKPKRVYLMLDMSNIDFSYSEGNLVINTEDIKKHDAILKVDVIMIKI
ncbi:MAG: alpha-L-fucosidase, partial [Clostridia bacterium]|nr:alpha-L-fucosidase [Clostridia bacterium]